MRLPDEDDCWPSQQKRADAYQHNGRWRNAADVLADAATKGDGTELPAQMTNVRAIATQLVNALEANSQRAECMALAQTSKKATVRRQPQRNQGGQRKRAAQWWERVRNFDRPGSSANAATMTATLMATNADMPRPTSTNEDWKIYVEGSTTSEGVLHKLQRQAAQRTTEHRAVDAATVQRNATKAFSNRKTSPRQSESTSRMDSLKTERQPEVDSRPTHLAPNA